MRRCSRARSGLVSCCASVLSPCRFSDIVRLSFLFLYLGICGLLELELISEEENTETLKTARKAACIKMLYTAVKPFYNGLYFPYLSYLFALIGLRNASLCGAYRPVCVVSIPPPSINMTA